MPIGEFPGARNWCYVSVLPFAPDAAYGPPDALKSLIDRAHGFGLSAFLDVVYNRFGSDANRTVSVRGEASDTSAAETTLVWIKS